MRKTALLLVCVLALLLTACSTVSDLSPDAQRLVGKWAYNYEPESAALILKADGSAQFEDIRYDRFAYDGVTLELSCTDGPAKHVRCLLDEGGMLLYKRTVFHSDGASDGLTGVWRSDEGGWSYEFSAEGRFLEDGTFSGEYTTDESAGTFCLHYADGQFADTLCYYSLKDGKLTVDYPWRMVKMK